MHKLSKNTTQQFNTIKSQLTLVKDKSKNQNNLWLKIKGPSALDLKKFKDTNKEEQLVNITNLSYPDAKKLLSSLNLEVPTIPSGIKNFHSLPMKRCYSNPIFSQPYWVNKNNSCLDEQIKSEIKEENIIETVLEDKSKWFIVNYLKLIISFVLWMFFIGIIIIYKRIKRNKYHTYQDCREITFKGKSK
jgi:hypothetical protein